MREPWTMTVAAAVEEEAAVVVVKAGLPGGNGRGGRGRRMRERRGRGSSRTSEAALHEGVAQQGVGRRPPLLLHKHLPQEVPAGVGHALGQRGLRGLRGDLEDGRHGFVLGPRRLLGQHLHHSAGHAPEDCEGKTVTHPPGDKLSSALLCTCSH